MTTFGTNPGSVYYIGKAKHIPAITRALIGAYGASAKLSELGSTADLAREAKEKENEQKD